MKRIKDKLFLLLGTIYSFMALLLFLGFIKTSFSIFLITFSITFVVGLWCFLFHNQLMINKNLETIIYRRL